MKTLLLAAALASGSLALEWNHEFTTELLANENMNELFEKWRTEHSKLYGSVTETLHRFVVFKDNMERIAQRNDDYYNGEISFKLRMNHFGDLTEEERSALFHPIGDRGDDDIILDNQNKKANVGGVTLTQFDWRDRGKVSRVKKQGACGSCWAFAAAAAMECGYSIASSNRPPDMSEQQLVDCTAGCHGCGGGWSDQPMDTAIAHGGMCAEGEYPYMATEGYCVDSACVRSEWKPQGYEYVPRRSTTALQEYVRRGCVAVYVRAGGHDFDYYSSGVMDGDCGPLTNHVVTATGFGTMDGKEYWIIKNSWDTKWGADGYIYLCRNCGKNLGFGQCGILSQRNVLPIY